MTRAVQIIIVVGALVIGGLGGYMLRDYQALQRRADCAASISAGTYEDCPSAIQDAVRALAQRSGETTIEYRDRTITELVRGPIEYRYIREGREADVLDLSNVERTNACAASPAFQRLREQLLRDAGAGAGPDPATDAPAS